jgi:hypothetical protein
MSTKAPHHREEFVTVAGQDHTCLFRRDGDGYLDVCSDTPLAHAYSKTLEQTHSNAAEEIEAWQENRAEAGG